MLIITKSAKEQIYAFIKKNEVKLKFLSGKINK